MRHTYSIRIAAVAVAGGLALGQARAGVPEFSSEEWMRSPGTGWSSARMEPSLPLPKVAPGPIPDRHTMRCYYLVPVDRAPQSDALDNLAETVLWIQEWYAGEMELNGFGRKTFEIESHPDGSPVVHLLTSDQTAAWLRADPWGRCRIEAAQAGVPHDLRGEVVLSAFEAHEMNPDSTLIGGYGGGANFGSGSSPGTGMVGSDALAFLSRSDLLDTREYDGLVIPALGPYPAIQDVTFAWFDGTTISASASVRRGIFLHELSHGFGLAHDFRNDSNFNGNMMGNGFRGTRGHLYTEEFPADYVRLTYASALQLNSSRYFNPETEYTEDTAPALTVLPGPTVAVSADGTLHVGFTASDASGISLALLRNFGETVAHLRFDGEPSVGGTFRTPHFETTMTNQLEISVFDTQGNRTGRSFAVEALPGGVNLAPRPSVNINPGRALAGQEVTLTAWNSFDPDGSVFDLTVEWDFDGDGSFDTGPTTDKLTVHQWDAPGIYTVTARVADPGGQSFVSMPVGIRILGPDPPVESDLMIIR